MSPMRRCGKTTLDAEANACDGVEARPPNVDAHFIEASVERRLSGQDVKKIVGPHLFARRRQESKYRTWGVAMEC